MSALTAAFEVPLRLMVHRASCTWAIPALLAATTVAVGLVSPSVLATHSTDHNEVTQTGSNTLLEALKQLTSSGGSGTEDFLPPDVAFVLSAEVVDRNTIVARWDIADGYYLYRDRLTFAVDDASRVAIGPAELPPGKFKEDEYFGRMEVYYGTVAARLPVKQLHDGTNEVQLDITYQGCADAGLCYPPITKTVSLSLPPRLDPGIGLSGRQIRVEPAGTLPEQDRLARALATGNVWLMLPAFFGLGLLLTFTPCVLPMIPILSSIIVGQGERLTTRRAFLLSLTYVLAMSATYTLAGVVAGLTGANLQAAFQNPWVLSAFSTVFVLLALSMFGLYDLQVPARLQQKLVALSSRQVGGTYVGVGVMGFLSALIIGPCVAAPLAGALIYIAHSGDAVVGGQALFALSLGMGTPVLAIGASAGRLMPKAGPWLKTVKSAFGVILVGVAIYLLQRLLPGWITLLLWSALFIGVAVRLGVLNRNPETSGGWSHFARGLGIVSFACGTLLVLGAATGGENVFRPLEGLAAGISGERAPLEFKTVKGIANLETELRLAKAEGRAVMLDFYADWCVSCKELERYTFRDPMVKEVLSAAVLLRTDVTANDTRDRGLLDAFGLFGPPAILFFGPDGLERPRYRVVGFMEAEPFRTQAQRGLSVTTTSVRSLLATSNDK